MTVTLGAQLSFTRSKGLLPSGFEEELVMLNPKMGNIFRAVATGAVAPPVVAIKNLGKRGQTVTFSCLEEGHTPSNTSFRLGPERMKLVRGCEHRDWASSAGDDPLEFQESRQAEVIGISVESNGPPESLAVFGVAPRSRAVYEPLAFTQIDSLRSSETVYTGAPVGPTRAFRGDPFVPELGVTNFLGTTAHVTVSYYSPVANADAAQIVAAMPVAPFSSVRIPVKSVAGDQNMRNSFIVSSDGAKGQVLSTLRSIPGPGGEFVEIPREDRKKPTDGGQHPWVTDNDKATYLVLFNSGKSAHTVGVSVYTEGGAKVSNGIAINPNQTTVLDLGTLSDRLMQTDSASDDAPVESRHHRPRHQGVVTWLSLDGNFIFGRVLQVDRNYEWSRNFSCQVEYIACGAYINPSSLKLLRGGTNTTQGYALVCPSSGVCTCDGSGACTGQMQVAPSNYWTIDDTSVASISGSPSQSGVSILGNLPGTAELDVSVTDGSSYQCSASSYWSDNTATITVQRPTASRITTTTQNTSLSSGQSPCAPGYAGWIRAVKKIVTDQAQSDIVASGQNLQETVTIGSPNDLNITGTTTGTTTTNSSGYFSDTLYVCSALCPASGGTTSATQTITDTYQGWAYSLSSNTFTYKCNGIQINGQ